MPYADPKKTKRHNREYYLAHRELIWKNPDGSWKAPKDKEARRAIGRAYYHRHKVRILEAWKQKRASRSRIDLCPICSQSTKMFADHNHSTGEFRGWICSPCNLALGHAKDSPEILRRLAKYLEEKTTGLMAAE